MSEQKTSNIKKKAGRPKRVKLEVEAQLKTEKREDHTSRWVAESLLDVRIKQGYGFIDKSTRVKNLDDTATITTDLKGSYITKTGRDGVKLYLMECPTKLVDQRNRERHDLVSQREREMSGTYSPENGTNPALRGNISFEKF